MTPEVFSQTITVTPKVIDNRNHVNNLAYLQWCMEAATSHWERNSSAQMQEDYIWYVLHHDVHYRAAAFLGEVLTLETWVSNNYGVRSERSFKITRPIDGKLLVEARTTWCLLDAKSQRPARITDEICNLFLNS